MPSRRLSLSRALDFPSLVDVDVLVEVEPLVELDEDELLVELDDEGLNPVSRTQRPFLFLTPFSLSRPPPLYFLLSLSFAPFPNPLSLSMTVESKERRHTTAQGARLEGL